MGTAARGKDWSRYQVLRMGDKVLMPTCSFLLALLAIILVSAGVIGWCGGILCTSHQHSPDDAHHIGITTHVNGGSPPNQDFGMQKDYL